MKRHLLISLLCAMVFVGCNNRPEEPEDKTTYTTLLIASKYGYIIDPDSGFPRQTLIIRESGEDGKWKPTLILAQNVLKYEVGYEYAVMAHKEPYMPGILTEGTGGLFWKIDKVLDKVQKDTELPDDVYLYTLGSPWGLDPRDPYLEYLLENYKEIFGEDCVIDYPTKY